MGEVPTTIPAAVEAYALAVDVAPNPMILVAPDSRIVRVNHHSVTLFGHDVDSLVGMSVDALVPARFRAAHPALRTAFLAAPHARAMGTGNELFALRYDGTEVPVEIGLNPIATPDGFYVLCSIVDLTRHKVAEERFRSAVETAPNAMLMIDPQGCIVLVNSQAERLFGFARAEMLGRAVEMLVPERSRGRHPDQRAGFLASPDARSMGEGRDLFALRKDGTEVPVEIGLNPISMEQGVFVLSAIVDITERKRAEAERQRVLEREQAALAEAHAAGRAKDEFLGILSHELRTPLNAILGWSSMLCADDMSRDDVRHAVAVIDRNARRQTRIIDDILDVSRMIQGRFSLEIAPCQPTAVVESVIATLQPVADAKHVEIAQSMSPVGSILADSARVEQIIWNLVSNAIKFSPAGSRVLISLRDLGSHVGITVSDHGIGIAPEFLDRVFDRFTQADSKSTREYSGLGLGLAIARQIAELHGGSIRAESPGLGQGSTFTVQLPVAPLQRSDTEHRTPLESSSRRPSRLLKGIRVLVVDDEEDTLELMCIGLSRLGATVLTANSVSAAMASLAEHVVDVLVGDVSMPGEDGYALIRKVREQRPLLPALALTAHASADDRRALLAAGYQVHVAKPIEPSSLATRIAAMATGHYGGHASDAL